MPETAIEVINLSKCYKIYARPVDRILDWISPFTRKRHRDFWALRQVSFTIPRGVAVGIIGANGAGKSTLLKIVSGTSKPSSGRIRVRGKVAALLELGMGFHPEFTGRQNIRMNGKLLGLTDEELDEKIPGIIAFSELGEFIDRPLRTYSSGMYVRLGFSVVASVDPEILIVDEALSVGDIHFQQKCIRRIREIHETGSSLLFVSHDPGAVRILCQEAILIDQGEIVSRGEPDEILDHYNALVSQRESRETSFHIERVPAANRHAAVRHSGNFMAVITAAGLLTEEGEAVTAVFSGQQVRIYVRVFFLGAVERPTIGFLIKDRLGNEVFGTNSYMLDCDLGNYSSGDTLEIEFSLKLDIGYGEYTLTAAAHAFDYHIYECYDWADKIFSFSVVPSGDFKFTGVAKCYPAIEHRKKHVPQPEARQLINDIFRDASPELFMGPSFQKFLCKGWYDCESSGEGYVRWTDREFAFFIRLEGDTLVLEVSCPKPDIDSDPITGKITVRGENLGEFRIRRTDPHTIRIPMPGSLKGELVLMNVSLNKSWKPSDYSGRDQRDLGIVVSCIRMELD